MLKDMKKKRLRQTKIFDSKDAVDEQREKWSEMVSFRSQVKRLIFMIRDRIIPTLQTNGSPSHFFFLIGLFYYYTMCDANSNAIRKESEPFWRCFWKNDFQNQPNNSFVLQ